MDAGSTAGCAILGERRVFAGDGGRRESTSINGRLLPRMLIGSPIDALIAPRTDGRSTAPLLLRGVGPRCVVSQNGPGASPHGVLPGVGISTGV